MRGGRLKLAIGLSVIGILLLYIAFSDDDDDSIHRWAPLHFYDRTDSNISKNAKKEGDCGGGTTRVTTAATATSFAQQPTIVHVFDDFTVGETTQAGVLSDVENLAAIVSQLNLTREELAHLQEAANSSLAELEQKVIGPAALHRPLAMALFRKLDTIRGSKRLGCDTLKACFLLALLNSTHVAALPTPFKHQDPGLELCPEVPPGLVGPLQVWMDTPSFARLGQLYHDLAPGGHGQPKHCKARHRVAIVIPYRDRESHLKKLLHNLHSLLSKQQLDYAIFTIEQVANQTFNRGKLMNVGFREASKLYDWQCFIFHDVDLLPEDDRNLYSCPVQPRHMSVAIDKFNYKLPYGSIFGGITAMSREHYEKLNGFSNDYWGWGGEDDDISKRVSFSGLSISRYPAEIARYKMIRHSHEAANPVNKARFDLLKQTKLRWQKDGLSNLRYKVVSTTFHPVFTSIKVDLLEEDLRKSLKNKNDT